MTAHLFMAALGLTLIHFLWQGAAIAAACKVATLFRPKPRDQYVLGLAALLAMAVAGVATLAIEMARVSSMTGAAGAGGATPTLDLTALLPWLDAAWLAGVSALGLRTLVGLKRIHSLSTQSQPVPDVLAQRFARMLARAGLNGVQLRIHPRIAGPFVVGIVRSVIYLPLSALSRLAPDQLDAVIAHELAHVRRADFAWNLLLTAVETLFFYHPAVWWLGARLREQRELCCDDAAVATGHDPVVYATALLSLAEQQRLMPALAMPFGAVAGRDGPSLALRIGRILGEVPAARRTGSGGLIAVMLAGGLLAVAVMAMQVAARPPVQAVPVAHIEPAAKTVTPPESRTIKPVKPHLHIKTSLKTPAPKAHAGLEIVDGERASQTELAPHILKQDVTADHATYIFAGLPRMAFLPDLVPLDPAVEAPIHPAFMLRVSPMKPTDQDYPAKAGGSGETRPLYRVDVTAVPDHPLPIIRPDAANTTLQIKMKGPPVVPSSVATP